MFKIIFTESYEKRAKKFLKKHADLLGLYEKTLKLMELNPYHPSLRLHKFSELFSVSINMQYRISIDFKIENDTIIPIDIGDHKQIYGKE
ncbi:MAG: plasmid stabilization protein [Treponema sp.]|nr:plasmid stabilization protein [Treponema sp.]